MRKPAADGVATLRLQHARAGVLSITVEPEGGDGASPLLERLDRISADMTARGVDLERVRARQREAASMVGPEVALRVQQGGASHGLALWIGSPREAAAPASRVVAQLVVQGDGLEPGLDLWDHVLDSISPGGTP